MAKRCCGRALTPARAACGPVCYVGVYTLTYTRISQGEERIPDLSQLPAPAQVRRKRVCSPISLCPSGNLYVYHPVELYVSTRPTSHTQRQPTSSNVNQRHPTSSNVIPGAERSCGGRCRGAGGSGVGVGSEGRRFVQPRPSGTRFVGWSFGRLVVWVVAVTSHHSKLMYSVGRLVVRVVTVEFHHSQLMPQTSLVQRTIIRT